MRKKILAEMLSDLFRDHGHELKSNAAASVSGQLLEIQFCKIHKYIEYIDGDGYDGIVLKDITFQLRGKTIIMKAGDKIEIKSKTEWAEGNIVAYDDNKKRNNYQWLVILYKGINGYRAAVIHHDELNEKVIDKDGAGMTLNLNQTHQKKSVLTDLFEENEYLNYNIIVKNK